MGEQGTVPDVRLYGTAIDDCRGEQQGRIGVRTLVGMRGGRRFIVNFCLPDDPGLDVQQPPGVFADHPLDLVCADAVVQHALDVLLQSRVQLPVRVALSMIELIHNPMKNLVHLTKGYRVEPFTAWVCRNDRRSSAGSDAPGARDSNCPWACEAPHDLERVAHARLNYCRVPRKAGLTLADQDVSRMRQRADG